MKKFWKTFTFWFVVPTALVCIQDALFDNSRFTYGQHLLLFVGDPWFTNLAYTEPYRSIILHDGEFIKILPAGYLIRIGCAALDGLFLDAALFLFRFVIRSRKKEKA